MEIISYVGGRQNNRLNLSIVLKRLANLTRKRASYTKQNTSSFANLTFNYSKPVSYNIKSKISYKRILKIAKKSATILSILILLALIPVTVFSALNLLEQKASPLKLYEPVDELEILNKELARFALEVTSDVEEDGSIVGNLVKYSFKEPVKFSNYTVKSGDTISGITKKFGLNNISTIIAINNINSAKGLMAGKKLVIPSCDGLYYNVVANDSIEKIAKKFNVSLEDLIDVNDLDSVNLVASQKLFIPGAKLDKQALRSVLGEHFVNPLRVKNWRLTSKCGYRADPFTGVRQYHSGIDMAIAPNTPIYAALDGKVVACGWHNVYGNYVIVSHGNGYQTLYGHMSKKLCVLNQTVTTNTKIGLVGSTGYSTGPHLHFTVLKNSTVIDPLTLIK